MRELSRQLRIGLQLKAVLVLTSVAFLVAIAGGWFYFSSARNAMQASDLRQAKAAGDALAVMASRDLGNGDMVELSRLAQEYVWIDGVRLVVILDGQGRQVARAARDSREGAWDSLVNTPAAVWHVEPISEDILTLCRPIVSASQGDQGRQVIGALRMVLDTSGTRMRLAKVQDRLVLVAGAVVLCVMPLGYLLVWRLIVQPIRRLAMASRKLADGDLAARSGLVRNDDIGELAGAFDRMAEQIQEAQASLVAANADLEGKVAQRTTQLELANTRLREEMADKDEFLRAVSHDLNAPLRNITGMVSMILLKWKNELPEDAIGRLGRVTANVQAQTELINELLELSRIRSRPQTRENVEMDKVLEDVSALLDYEIKAHNIELRIAPGLPRLHVEKNRIRQVFQNLIDNAVKYMHRAEGGWIEVGHQVCDGMHVFSVKDNGPGIRKEDLSRIFCVFRRAETPETAKVPGKGVGLALVRTVTSNYGGRAWCESHYGEGTTFFVSLSVENTRPQAAAGRREYRNDSVAQPVGPQPL